MRLAKSLIALCFLAPVAAVTMGAGVWEDGAYSRWYSNDDAGLSIEPLKKFAIGYVPRTVPDGEVVWCRDMPAEYDDSVANILRRRVIDDEYKAYVSLVILKLYNCHYKYNGLSEDFDDKPDRLESLNLVHGAYVKLLASSGLGIENPLTYEVVNYLAAAPDLLKNQYIQKELSRTCELTRKRGDKAGWKDCRKLLR